MTTKAETYFLGEIADDIDRAKVRASGYFRTFMKDHSGSGTIGKLGAFVDAIIARGYFVALSDLSLHVVQTRAPATSAPLLENTGLIHVPLSDISRVFMTDELLLIQWPGGGLSLQMTVSNKAFTQQSGLVDALAEHFDLPERAESILKKQRHKRLKKFGFVALAVVVGVVWVAFRSR